MEVQPPDRTIRPDFPNCFFGNNQVVNYFEQF